MPRRAFVLALAALLLAVAPTTITPPVGAEEKAEAERPNPMRVFRSVLDERARMITVPLHRDMWLAYDATHSADNRFTCLTCHTNMLADGLAWSASHHCPSSGPRRKVAVIATAFTKSMRVASHPPSSDPTMENTMP